MSDCNTCIIKRKLSCQSCRKQLCSKPKSYISKLSCSGAVILETHIKTSQGLFCMKCLGEN